MTYLFCNKFLIQPIACFLFLFKLYKFMMTFKDWLVARESTAFTRTLRAAADGTGPSIPDASINSHSTAKPWEKDAIMKRNKKKSKKKRNP